MSHTIPTVKVVSPSAPGGHVIINERDLTPEHEIWTGEAKPVKDVSGTISPDDIASASEMERHEILRPTFNVNSPAAKKNR